MRGVSAFFAVMLLAGCATTVPEAIRTAPSSDISVAKARADAKAYIGQRVRWGGTVARVENHEASTDLEIVARELDRLGRPQNIDSSFGRFIARVTGFLDPVVYSEGRYVTIAGTITEEIIGRIGEHTYRYPLVNADSAYLWEPLRAAPNPYPYRDPFYDPFWHPWYPWSYYYLPHYHP